MKEKIVLQGVFQTFSKKTINRPYYSEEEYLQFLEEFNHKQIYKRRKEIVDKLLKSIHNSNE